MMLKKLDIHKQKNEIEPWFYVINKTNSKLDLKTET
jgi:hypothetical protein